MSAVLVGILILISPVLGGLIYGVERVVKARMQNRIGPPVFQPFYDFYKLMDKRTMIVHSYHASLGVMHFLAAWFALGVLLAGGDLVMVIFLHLMASALLIMGGYSVKSAFSQLGANRELIAMLTHEPIYIIAAVGFYLLYGSFEVSNYLGQDIIPLASMPLIFLAVIFAMLIKLKKSPFDAAEAHQEIIGGAEIEYSGKFYEALYTAKWLEYVYVYAFIVIFCGFNILLSILVGVLTFLLINAIDNSTGRVNYQDMVKITYKYAIPAALLNLALLVI